MTITSRMRSLDKPLKQLLPTVESWYKDFHAHPELSCHEFRTAEIVAKHLKKFNYDVHTGLGKTGVVGILNNGDGQTVMLRADMDALPIEEKTGLSYASKETAELDNGKTVHVGHMCGHDTHVSCLMAVGQLMAEHTDQWKGTLMLVFQPGEETADGALGMIKDMEDTFPKPDIILGQHVMVGEAGTIAYKKGAILSAGDSLDVTLHGRGGHGSMPQNTIDPVIMAAYTAIRLQSIVSREVSPMESAVVTIGSIQAGNKENVIPDTAILKLNIRTYDEAVREKVIKAVKRICISESEASGAECPPEFTNVDCYPVTINDPESTDRLAKSFHQYFGTRAIESTVAPASEDFSYFGRKWKVPYVFWFFGSTPKDVWEKAIKEHKISDIPANHSSEFAPEIEPTLQTGVEAMLVAAFTWL